MGGQSDGQQREIPAEFTSEREVALKIVGEGAVLGYDPERPLSSETRHRVRQKRAYWLGGEQCQNEKGPRSGVPSWGFPKNTLIWANSQISQKPAQPQILSKPTTETRATRYSVVVVGGATPRSRQTVRLGVKVGVRFVGVRLVDLAHPSSWCHTDMCTSCTCTSCTRTCSYVLLHVRTCSYT